jgi:hypothetical protein
MRMTIRYTSGLRVEGLLLAADSNRMRIAIASQRDTAELRRVGSSWHTEDEEAVEIEAIFQLPGIDASDFCAEVYPITATAGRNPDR